MIGETKIITEPGEGSGHGYTLPESPTAKAYYDYILALHPKRIIFNPGAENEELNELAQAV